jgi:hypothetical protein
MLRSTLCTLTLIAGLSAAMPAAMAQSNTTTTTEQPRSRARQPSTAREARQPSPAQLAARQRMRDCGAEWRALRGTPQAQNRTWRQFSSECLRRGRAEAPARRSRSTSF